MLSWESPGEYEYIANIPCGTLRVKLIQANTWHLTCSLTKSDVMLSRAHPDELLGAAANMLQHAVDNLRMHIAQEEGKKLDAAKGYLRRSRQRPGRDGAPSEPTG